MHRKRESIVWGTYLPHDGEANAALSRLVASQSQQQRRAAICELITTRAIAQDLLLLTAGATLSIVHFGLIAPWAQRLMEAGI